MPVVAAILFEFCLRELRLRTLATRADRKLSTLRWLHPAERIRIQLSMAADEHVSAEAATKRVCVTQAARRLYQLRAALSAHDQSATPSAAAGRRVRRAERRAHGALTRAGFTDPVVAAAVLGDRIATLTMSLCTSIPATRSCITFTRSHLLQQHRDNRYSAPPARALVSTGD